MKPILETARLRLREMSLADLDLVAAMIGDPEMMRYFPRVYTRDEARDWIEQQLRRYAEFGHGMWAVELRDTGEAVGQVGLTVQEVDGRLEREIGWRIHRPFWRRGYATEAALGVRDYAFAECGLDYVISLVRPENEPSAGVARKLGMRPVRETVFKDLRHQVFMVERAAVEPG